MAGSSVTRTSSEGSGRRRGAAPAAALAALLLLLLAAAPAQASIGGRIGGILSAWGFSGSGTGVRVVDMDTGRTLFNRNTTTRLAPASNMKLVTASTALAKLGAEYRFRTELYVPPDPPDTGGVLRGSVYLKGYGDPTLCTASYASSTLHRPSSRLDDFVTMLVSMGVTRITGHVVGDESLFDGRRTVSTWAPGEWQDCGPLSALSLNEGVVDGVRVSDPGLGAARRLTEMLESHGIDVAGAPRTGTVPSTYLLRYTEYSPPLYVVLAGMDKPSDNFYAEEITKALGALFRGTGSTVAGDAVKASFLEDSGIPSSQFVLADGSGLSHQDRLTAWSIVKLLRVMAARPDYPLFWASLSIAGHDGTLYDRMRGTPAQNNLHGKTGTISIASCLSGYETTANGHHVVFSMLMNRSWIDVSAAHKAQDAIAVALARSRP